MSMPDAESRLLGYLNMLGAARFRAADFSNAQFPQYAIIELDAKGEVVERLGAFIGTELSENNGQDAYLRFLAVSDLGNGRFLYFGEVVVREHIAGEREKHEATERYLASLPRAIRNFRLKGRARAD